MSFTDWLGQHEDGYPALAEMKLPGGNYWTVIWAVGERCDFDWDTIDAFVGAWEEWEEII